VRPRDWRVHAPGIARHRVACAATTASWGCRQDNIGARDLNLHRARGLQRINLVGANLQRANLRGANLQRAIYSDDIWWPEGFDAAGAGARQSQVPAS
jgi:Pentapeptide repeats (8 copies)